MNDRGRLAARAALMAALALACFGLAPGCGGEGSELEAGFGDDTHGEGTPSGTLFDPGMEKDDVESCASATIEFTQRIPYVVLLVDQSGSMEEPLDGGTRWSVLHDALLDPSDGIVKKLEDDVRFGLALYTSQGGDAGGTCPMLGQVSAEFGNYQAIKDVYDAAAPEKDTPTGESLLAVAKQLDKIYLNVGTPKVIVLATDGEPDTCENPNPEGGGEKEAARAKSIAAAQEAFQMGIETYVISVGDQVGLPHLQDMANAGLGMPLDAGPSAEFWQADNHGELADAFDTIVGGVRDCVFNLDGNVVPGYENQGVVTLDGVQLLKDDPDGWKLNSSSEVQILGDACEAVQEGDHAVDVNFPCGGFEAPPIQ